MRTLRNINSKKWFSVFARKAAFWSGTPPVFLTAVLIIVVWGLTGPIFNFNDTWQLVINTSTTIITFLMVFLIQNAQNRDSVALQVKLDELIRATAKAHNSLIDLEELEEDQLEMIHQRFLKAAKNARDKSRADEDFDPENDEESSKD